LDRGRGSHPGMVIPVGLGCSSWTSLGRRVERGCGYKALLASRSAARSPSMAVRE
jgi:hypothetical protein